MICQAMSDQACTAEKAAIWAVVMTAVIHQTNGVAVPATAEQADLMIPICPVMITETIPRRGQKEEASEATP